MGIRPVVVFFPASLLILVSHCHSLLLFWYSVVFCSLFSTSIVRACVVIDYWRRWSVMSVVPVSDERVDDVHWRVIPITSFCCCYILLFVLMILFWCLAFIIRYGRHNVVLLCWSARYAVAFPVRGTHSFCSVFDIWKHDVTMLCAILPTYSTIIIHFLARIYCVLSACRRSTTFPVWRRHSRPRHSVFGVLTDILMTFCLTYVLLWSLTDSWPYWYDIVERG